MTTRVGLFKVRSVHVHMTPHHKADMKIVMLKFVWGVAKV